MQGQSGGHPGADPRILRPARGAVPGRPRAYRFPCPRSSPPLASPARERAPPDLRLLPGGCLRPDQQLRGHRPRAARARPPRGVHRRGVLQGSARGEGLRGTAHEADAARGGRRGPGPVLEGLHPRDGTGLSQADHRAARGLHRSHLPGADRRRQARRPAAGRDHRRDPAGRDRRGQRRELSGAVGLGPALGADRVLQPGRGEGPAGAADLLRLPHVRRLGLGGLPPRVRALSFGHARRLRRVLSRTGSAGAARARVHAHLALVEPVDLSARGGLRACRRARPVLAQPGGERPRPRTPPGPYRSRWRRARVRSST